MEAYKKSMRMFGMPYQFTPQTDPRMAEVSETIGRKFLRNVSQSAPICTIIPGKPKYLPGIKKKDQKVSTTAALIAGAGGNFSTFEKYLNQKNEDMRLYDFQRAYTEYMSYVNILCRTGASFLELNRELDGTSLCKYDWRNYRTDTKSYQSIAGKLLDKTKDSIVSSFNDATARFRKRGDQMLYKTVDADDEEIMSWEEALTNTNYVQFYVDPDIQCNESMQNQTGESILKGALNSGSDSMKDIAFMANSGGIDTSGMTQFADDAGNNISAALESVTGGSGITGALSRIVNLSGNVIKGENVIMPDIYQNSSLTRSYTITVHLRAPYGTKLGYYMDVFVPMMHLLGLALPKQTTANTYGAPFLVKIYVDGRYTCNLGLVTNININKIGDCTIDGLASEVDVTLDITDLYSDLTMSPQSDPLLFLNNSSLVEYLATNCGMSLIAPNSSAKLDMVFNTAANTMGDITTNVAGYANEWIDKSLKQFTGLTF